MIAKVREALQEQRARSQLRGELVFPSEQGTAIDLANFRARNWDRIVKRAKVRPRTLYQCRHTFARLAIEYGDTPQHLAAQLGHTSVEMVFRVYSRWMTRPASRLEALEKSHITHPSPKVAGQLAASDGK
jgi:integrase